MTPEGERRYSRVSLYDSAPLEMRRPHWFVDAKWISGIAFAFALSVALALYGLYTITEQKTSVEILATTMATVITAGGNQGTISGNVDEMVKKARAYPDQDVQLPPFTVAVKGREVSSLASRDAATYVLRKVFERFYSGGPNGLAQAIDDPATHQDILTWSTSFTFFTGERHEQLKLPVILAAAGAALIAILLVLFSFRFGKLASLGCSLVAAGLPCAAAFSLLASPAILGIAADPSAQGPAGLAGAVMPAVLPLVGSAVSQTYILVAAAGICMIALSIMGSLTLWMIRKVRQPEVPPEAGTAEPVPTETEPQGL